jgi:hydroxymethylbilane synthase
MQQVIRIGTRGSALALWQTEYVAGLLRAAWPELRVETQIFTTRGDQVLDVPLPSVGGKGLFTAELEAALRAGTIDLAVHSLKDLPTDDPDGLTVGANPPRENPADVLIARGGHTLMTLPEGAKIGTSSLRRAAQLRHVRPDLEMRDIRGNVDTRVRKALDADGPYDAIVLAAAGLTRLGKGEGITEVLPLEHVLPAPGQGALGIQCRADADSRSLLAPLNDAPTALAVAAERGFLAGLGGGCSVPVSALATIDAGRLMLRGRVSALDGRTQIDVSGVYDAATPEAARAAGVSLARDAHAHGADAILEAIRA